MHSFINAGYTMHITNLYYQICIICDGMEKLIYFNVYIQDDS